MDQLRSLIGVQRSIACGAQRLGFTAKAIVEAGMRLKDPQCCLDGGMVALGDHFRQDRFGAPHIRLREPQCGLRGRKLMEQGVAPAGRPWPEAPRPGTRATGHHCCPRQVGVALRSQHASLDVVLCASVPQFREGR